MRNSVDPPDFPNRTPFLSFTSDSSSTPDCTVCTSRSRCPNLNPTSFSFQTTLPLYQRCTRLPMSQSSINNSFCASNEIVSRHVRSDLADNTALLCISNLKSQHLSISPRTLTPLPNNSFSPTARRRNPIPASLMSQHLTSTPCPSNQILKNPRLSDREHRNVQHKSFETELSSQNPNPKNRAHRHLCLPPASASLLEHSDHVSPSFIACRPLSRPLPNPLVSNEKMSTNLPRLACGKEQNRA